MSARPGTHLYRFVTGEGKTREFGPYPDEHEAAEAFQRAYGYWPDAAILARPFVPEPAE